MEIAILTNTNRPNSIDNFMDFYYSLQMRYFASDLLNQGLSPKQINNAVVKAITIARSSGMDINKHFKPVFSCLNTQVINDCKLSRLGYGLVLMNAESNLSAVGKWQRQVLEKFLDNAYTI